MKTVIKKEWMGTIRPNIHLAAIALLVFALLCFLSDIKGSIAFLKHKKKAPV